MTQVAVLGAMGWLLLGLLMASVAHPHRAHPPGARQLATFMAGFCFFIVGVLLSILVF